ncbi:MAG: hypothetical protein QOH69_178 [Actinomycetota bacterium]|jgi:predicted ATPase|nr:hypothetical protein [Actinomycetota bacterium]
MPDALSFQRLQISNWRQFLEVDIDLSKQLTVLTGENGTGKTTLLSVLASHFGFQNNFVGTPAWVEGHFLFLAGRDPRWTSLDVSPVDPNVGVEFESIGRLIYASGEESDIGIWGQSSAPEFGVTFKDQQQVPGLSLDSHRIVPSYGRVENVPGRFKNAQEINQEYRQQLWQWKMPNLAIQRKSPALLMKESLIAAAIYGEGNSALVPDTEAAAVWTGFQQILSKLLPPSLEFTRLQIDHAEVLVETKGGTFALEAASGGASAIFDLAWQIYLQSRESDTFTVCFDEPENHLHPSLQRSILPQLLSAFPSVKFIVATHSPFVVTSSKDASVYVLRRDREGRVFSEALDLREQALTADEVLREVLGVGTTLPLWAESEFDVIMRDFADRQLNPEDFVELARRLRSAGIRFSVPEVTDTVSDELESSTE